jgi:hypothetical protein
VDFFGPNLMHSAHGRYSNNKISGDLPSSSNFTYFTLSPTSSGKLHVLLYKSNNTKEEDEEYLVKQ